MVFTWDHPNQVSLKSLTFHPNFYLEFFTQNIYLAACVARRSKVLGITRLTIGGLAGKFILSLHHTLEFRVFKILTNKFVLFNSVPLSSAQTQIELNNLYSSFQQQKENKEKALKEKEALEKLTHKFNKTKSKSFSFLLINCFWNIILTLSHAFQCLTILLNTET